MPISNLTNALTSSLVNKKIVRNTLATIEADPVLDMFMSDLAPIDEATQVANLGQTVEVKMKPYLVAQRYSDLAPSVTPATGAYENAGQITIEDNFGLIVPLSSASIMAGEDSGIDVANDLLESAILATARVAKARIVTTARTNSNFTAIGNGATPLLTFNTLVRVRRVLTERNVPVSTPVYGLTDAQTFAELLSLTEIQDNQKKFGDQTTASNFAEIFIKTLNMYIRINNDYTAKVGTSDPKITFVTKNTIIPTYRVSGTATIQGMPSNNERIIRSNNFVMKLSMMEVAEGLHLNKNLAIEMLGGVGTFRFAHSAALAGNLGFGGMHVIGAL